MTWVPADQAGPSESGPRALGESLDAVTRGLGGPPARPLAAVFTRWHEVVGATIAAHSRPLSLRDGVLRVAVYDPGWATQLRYLETDLLRRCDEILGEGLVGSVELTVRRS